jgi:PadR family transcriptional regulator, regulatory protein PadR
VVTPGSLYPALHRLEERGLVAAEWGASENNRRAKFYTLTAAGRRQLRQETAQWARFSDAVNVILRDA